MSTSSIRRAFRRTRPSPGRAPPSTGAALAREHRVGRRCTVDHAACDDATVLRAPVAQDARQLARVDVRDADDVRECEVRRQVARGAEVRHRSRQVADHQARRVHALRFGILAIHADVADVRIGQRDDLALVRRIGEDLLVAGHRGVEHDFADGACRSRRSRARGTPSRRRARAAPGSTGGNSDGRVAGEGRVLAFMADHRGPALSRTGARHAKRLKRRRDPGRAHRRTRKRGRLNCKPPPLRHRIIPRRHPVLNRRDAPDEFAAPAYASIRRRRIRRRRRGSFR